MSNPVAEFRARLLENLDTLGSLTRELIDQIEAELRADWGGDRYYYPRNGEPDAQLGARNRAIIRDWRNGERVELIARRHAISKRRVWQIVKG